MAGVPLDVVLRAESVSQQFFSAFNDKLINRRQSKMPIVAQADFAWLMRVVKGLEGAVISSQNKKGILGEHEATLADQLDIVERCAGGYEIAEA